jgi:hypothetical protein
MRFETWSRWLTLLCASVSLLSFFVGLAFSVQLRSAQEDYEAFCSRPEYQGLRGGSLPPGVRYPVDEIGRYLDRIFAASHRRNLAFLIAGSAGMLSAHTALLRRGPRTQNG